MQSMHCGMPCPWNRWQSKRRFLSTAPRSPATIDDSPERGSLTRGAYPSQGVDFTPHLHELSPLLSEPGFMPYG